MHGRTWCRMALTMYPFRCIVLIDIFPMFRLLTHCSPIVPVRRNPTRGEDPGLGLRALGTPLGGRIKRLWRQVLRPSCVLSTAAINSGGESRRSRVFVHNDWWGSVEVPRICAWARHVSSVFLWHSRQILADSFSRHSWEKLYVIWQLLVISPCGCSRRSSRSQCSRKLRVALCEMGWEWASVRRGAACAPDD